MQVRRTEVTHTLESSLKMNVVLAFPYDAARKGHSSRDRGRGRRRTPTVLRGNGGGRGGGRGAGGDGGSAGENQRGRR